MAAIYCLGKTLILGNQARLFNLITQFMISSLLTAYLSPSRETHRHKLRPRHTHTDTPTPLNMPEQSNNWDGNICICHRLGKTGAPLEIAAETVMAGDSKGSECSRRVQPADGMPADWVAATSGTRCKAASHPPWAARRRSSSRGPHNRACWEHRCTGPPTGHSHYPCQLWQQAMQQAGEPVEGWCGTSYGLRQPAKARTVVAVAKRQRCL